MEEKTKSKGSRHRKLYTGYKDKETLSRRELDLIFLKWGFLRRNKDYRDFYNKYKDVFYGKDCFKAYSPERREELLGILRYDFGIQYLLNPYRRFNRKIFNEDKIIRRILYDFIEPQPAIVTSPLSGPSLSGKKDKQGRIKWEPIPEHLLAKVVNLKLEINLNCSRTAILKEIEKIVKSWQSPKKRYDASLLFRTALRPEHFKDYLKIWDYKNAHPNATWPTIAKRVLRVGKIDFLTMRVYENRISKEYKTCCNFIDGGYRKITL